MTFYPRVTPTSIGAQPVDSDLTSIAALATTSTGRSLLAAANAGAIRTIADAQALDADLTSIAALGTAGDKFAYTTGANAWAEAAITTGGRAFVAGTATAAQVEALGAEAKWTRVVLGSDFTTPNAAATAITGLAFAPAASTIYEVEAQLLLRESSIGVAVRPGIAWPTGLDDGVASFEYPEITNVTAVMGNIAADVAPSPTATGDDIAESWPCTVRATIVAGGTPAGNFQLTVKSETGGTNVSVKKGSWIRYRAIS